MTSVLLYYLPGLNPASVKPETFAEVGLEEVLADALDDDWRSLLHEVRKGPDGLSGTVVAAPPGDIDANRSWSQVPGYYPDRQEWRELHNGLWLGFEREHPPTPEALQRSRPLVGYVHTLGDGNAWHCPTIRRGLFVPTVPCFQDRVGAGIQRRVKPEWESLWHRSLAWASQEFSGDWESAAERWDAAAACLAVNYRVGREEINALGLFDDAAITLVLDAALDVPFFEDLLESEEPEKKGLLVDIRRALASGTLGGAASSPDTSRASPN